MQQLIHRFCGWALILFAGASSAWGFALGGPLKPKGGDAWQVPAIGYDLGGDVSSPRNIGEEYRRNTPILYYAYAASFSSYFGSNGEAAVDQAITIMNTISNVDSYSSGLYEEPLNSQIKDYTAETLGLTDLKSFTLPILLEQIGLAEPERYVWTLHDRYLPSGGKCPIDELYTVVQRNFDPVTSSPQQLQYSPYINGTLYSYYIAEACTGPNPLAVTIPFSPDPYASTYTAVAGLGVGLGSETIVTNGPWIAIGLGGVYQGLTRDDVAGMRYLYSRTNVLYESAASGATMYSITTNTSVSLFPALNTSNVLTSSSLTNVFGTNGFYYFYYYDGTYGYGSYAQLMTLSRVSSPALLQALYPGLVISSTSNYFILATNITINYYFTNLPGTLVGNNPVIRSYTTTNYYPLELYVNTFANVYTNHLWSSNFTALMVTNTVGPQPGKLVGTIYTNTTAGYVTTTNLPNADFFILPPFYTNVCPLDLAYTLQTNVYTFTNILNQLTVSNVVVAGSTNNVVSGALSYSSTISEVVTFTNYLWVTYPVTCAAVTNATGWYRGIGGVQFTREPDGDMVDPLTDQFVTAFTNNYTMDRYNPTNNSFQTQYFQRVVTAPDILFEADDEGFLPNSLGGTFLTRSLSYNQSDALPGLAGPGTIEAFPNTISFNKIGDVFGNGSLADNLNNLGTVGSLNQYSSVGLLAWGSFDGSTNPPVVYPNGTSLGNLQSQLVLSISSTPATVQTNGLEMLPNGHVGTAYAVQFTATGGTSPYTWSIATVGGALPAGLSFSPSTPGLLTGTVSPSAATGTYDFTIQVTDTANRVVTFSGYTITILP